MFRRSRLEIQEKVLRVILQRTQSRRRDRECYKAIPPRSSFRQDQSSFYSRLSLWLLLGKMLGGDTGGLPSSLSSTSL